jgi:hypothetical protein
MFRKIHAFWLAGVMVLAGSVLATASPAAAATTETGFQGTAYGTQVNVGSVVTSGRSALAFLGCTSTPGVTRTNTAASVGVPGVLTTGTINTGTASETTASGVASTSSSTIEHASLLGGLVSATAVKSVSTTGRNNSTGAFSVSAAGTTFAGLSVAGVPISGTPAPNTKLTLPGVGYIILNQQTSHVRNGSADLTVTGLRVVVTLGTPLAPVGTQIVVSSAESSLGGPVAGLLDGLAYGANANVGSTVIAGEQFPQPLYCLGTDGNTDTNSAVSVLVPGILTSGTVADTAEGSAGATQVSGEVTSTVQGLNLLSGLVRATVVKADVTASGKPPALGDHSSFAGLSVAGFPGIGDNVPPNTSVPLAGIGTLWLHKVTKTAQSITVVMLQLDVTVAGNPLGLGAGTQVNVAYAQIGVH